jgi:hypothetical protein
MARFTTPGTSTGRPTDSPLGSYFRTGYGVGSEEVRKDIPAPVLLETVSRALLVLRNCVLQILGDDAARVRRHPLYVFGFNLPLLAFHSVVRLWRRASWATVAACGLVALACIVTLTIGFFFRDSLFWSRDGYHLAAIVWLVVVPALLLVLGLLALAEYARENWWWARLLIDVAGLAAVAALATALIRWNALLLGELEWLRIGILLVFVALPAALLVLRIVLSLGRRLIAAPTPR